MRQEGETTKNAILIELQEKLKAFVAQGVEVKTDPKDPLVLLVLVPRGLLEFPFRKAEIPQQGIEFLEDFVPKLAETACSPQFRKEINSIVVEGHTDSVGTDEYNLRLSQNRSLEVVFESLHALSDLQQNSETMSNLRLCFLDFLSANGRGKVEPIGDQTTEEGRARSRRVVFKIRVRSWEQRQQLREVLGPAAPTTSWSTE
jgi:outer membrane protein OmpA-like peptidoglycan-associated protein